MVSFKYWDDCVDPQDMEAMWRRPEVSTEWLDAGESMSQKVHLSRDPDGQNYLTQIEMRAVADIIVDRYFDSQIDSDMLSALAELESDRQLLARRYDRKTKQTTIGIMQISPKTAEWLVRPFVNVYFGAACLKYLVNFDKTAIQMGHVDPKVRISSIKLGTINHRVSQATEDLL